MGLSLTLILALLSLAAVLAFAVARPRGWPEAFAAVPAVLLVLVGLPDPMRAGNAHFWSGHHGFDGLGVVAWVAWAACCGPLLAAVVRKVRRRDVVVTGEGRSFHSGVPVGSVVSIERGDATLYQTAVLKTAVDLGALDRVVVVSH